jgi:CDP-diacylglycerol--serine O-phosphatidyltransferase
MNKKKIAYLFPNLMTITCVFFGFLSILSSVQGMYARAALFIILVAVLDAFDGIVARATNTQSDFGERLDSLADSFSFGASTSFLIFFWGLQNTHGSHAIVICFIFLAASILRLASFMVIPRISPDRKYYLGLTVASSSLLLAGFVIYHPLPLEAGISIFLLALLILILSLLMVSNLKYRNLLHFDFHRKTDIITALAATLVIIACILYPLCFIIITFLYIMSGPAGFLLRFLKQPLVEEHRVS